MIGGLVLWVPSLCSGSWDYEAQRGWKGEIINSLKPIFISKAWEGVYENVFP